MNLRLRRADEPEVNLTSLIDVVLLLLIFFMVSTSFVREAELKIALPEASVEASNTTAERALEITVTSQGTYLVNGEALINSRADTLRRAIRRTMGDVRDVPVTIRADAEAKHQSVVTAMDVIGRLGYVNLQITTLNRAGTDGK